MYSSSKNEPSLDPSTLPLNSDPVTSSNSSFQEFLWQHIELAQTKGFDDNLGRNPVPSLFEVSIR